MSNSVMRLLFIVVCLPILLAVTSLPQVSVAAPPLLLSLDVERSGDVKALAKIDLQDPATYFVTGEFATNFPVLVRDLAQRGTVGSHSYAHPRLTEMEPEAVFQDLLNSVKAIESATGQPPIWFRAPFLEINEEIMEIAAELGFRYDSSEAERWVNQSVLKEFPISMNATSRILISDYDIFHSYALDDQMTLELLKQNYLDRFGTGRPFVFLLHPSIIAEKADLLHLFIDFVKRQGGQLMSFDTYLQQHRGADDWRIGIHLDPGSTKSEPEALIRDLQTLGVTDVFVRIHDDSGNSYLEAETDTAQTRQRLIRLVDSLQQQSIRAHAWLSALYDPSVAATQPQLAMADGNGTPSKIWLSPSQQSTRVTLKNRIKDLLQTLPVSGVHIDHLAYPGFSYDYSTAALNRFAQDTGIEVPHQKASTLIPEPYYNEWVSWRMDQITALAEAALQAVESAEGEILLSGSMGTDSLMSYREMELAGQDYRRLADYLELIISTSDVATWTDKSYTVPGIATVSASMIGDRPLMIGISDLTDDRGGTADLEVLSGELALARNQGAGLILPPYHTLAADQQASPEKIETLRQLLSSSETSTEPPVYDPKLSITYDIPDKSALPQPQPGNSYLNQDTVVGTAAKVVAPDSAQLEKEVVEVASSERQVEEEVSSPARTPEKTPTTPAPHDSPEKEAAEESQNSSPGPSPLQTVGVSPYFIAAGLILVLMLVYYWLKQYRPGQQQEQHHEEEDIIDWQKMDELITTGAITGSLVHSVARHLRIYDPIDTSRYRVALILHLVDERPQSIDELVKIDLQVPGWQVLVMSHLKEALMYGFLEIEDNFLMVTDKGRRELVTLQEQGFNPQRWIFAEQRLHEHLLVNCPHCNAENTGHWYWTKFSCTRCGNDILFKQCSTIKRSPNAGIELSLHQYA